LVTPDIGAGVWAVWMRMEGLSYKMDAQELSSANARLLVIEMAVAALIGQLPLRSLEEVAGMLCFVAGVTEEVEELAPSIGETQLGHVRHWASEMLDRIMVSRKIARPDTVGPVLSSGF